MKSLQEILNPIFFIATHPLNRGKRIQSLVKFFTWQLLSRFGSFSLIFKWVNNSTLLINKGESGITGNFYVGLMEFEDMSFLLHTLQKETIFIDIGANMGAYTILASKVCGSKSIAFEPVPSSYNRLCDQVRINNIEHLVTKKNIGLAKKDGYLYFTKNLNAMNKVSLDKNKTDSVLVKVSQLDSEISIDNPLFLKIDVEGYEYDVLLGAKKILESSNLLGIILEINNCGLSYGHTKEDIHNFLTTYNLIPIRYYPFTRDIYEMQGFNKKGGNTIYVRNIEIMRGLAKSAPKIYIRSNCDREL
jgi:FkbM family methyltransferase